MSSLLLDLPIKTIKFSKNYRTTFPANSLKELAQSIRQHGVIQPVIVRRVGEFYELIAGDRRMKAAEIAGLMTVPARVIEATDAEVLEMQLVENVQREVVPYYEEALALKRLRDKPYNYDVSDIAMKIGKSEQYVYFQLKLTQMCLEARRVAERGEISKTVAWFVSRIQNVNTQANVARALARDKKSKLVSERFARQYYEDLKSGKFTDRKNDISNTINADPTKTDRIKKFYTPDMSDYLKDWKKYLLKLTPEQFAFWRDEVAGRCDTLVWARAVEIVMTRHKTVNTK